MIVSGSEPSGSEARRAARRARGVSAGYWVFNLILALLAAAAVYMAYLRVIEPDQFDWILAEAEARGRQSYQWVMDHPPSRWIDTVLNRSTARPESEPEEPADEVAEEGTETIAAAPEPDETPVPAETSPAAEEPTEEDTEETPSAPEPTSAAEAEPTPSAPDPTATAAPPYVEISGDTQVNLRSGPGVDYDIVGNAQPDTRHVATGVLSDGTWCRIEFQDQEAWVACYLNTVNLFNGDSLPIVSQW